MTEAWLCAVLAGRVARLRALAARGETATIAKHLEELEHLAKVGGLEALGQAARSGDVDAIARATPALAEGHHLIPSQAVLVNLAAIARAEGAAIEVEAMPLILPGPMTVRLAVAIAIFMGDALDHGSKALAIGIKLDGNRIVADVRATDPGSIATLSLPRPY
jgi:hypothetical protein